MQQQRLNEQIDFLMEIDKLKTVLRQSCLIHTDRRENAAEHSWHVAVMAMLLAEYAAPDIDRLHVLHLLLIHDIVEMALRMEQAGVDPDVSRTLLAVNVDVTTERLTKQGRGGSGQLNFFFGLAIAMLLYMTIFIYGLNVLRGVLEEKQSRVAEVVISSIPASRLLAGKVLGVGGVGLTQVVLWLTMSFAMYKVRAPILAKFGASDAPMAMPDLSWGMGAVLIAFFVLGFMLYAGLFAAVGATVNSEQEAQQAQMPVVLLLISSIMFAQNILLQPDSMLSRVLSMLPFSAPIVMPLRMTVAPVPSSDVAIALLSVTLGAFGAVWLASRIYRVGLLMYGKRPTIGEVLKWVKQK